MKPVVIFNEGLRPTEASKDNKTDIARCECGKTAEQHESSYLLSLHHYWYKHDVPMNGCQWCEQITPASIPQPPPAPGKLVVVEQVLKDIQERSDFGFKKYGTRLETNNGRDALWDAYQEAIDLVMYLRQALLERENK